MASLTLQPNNNRFYWFLILISLFVLWILILPPSCNKQPLINAEVNVIKDRIKADIIKKDSVKSNIIYKDSIRDVHHHHWHTIRKDSLIPCEEKLIVCDTLLMADSSLIASLKYEIILSDSTIRNYQKVAVIDSNEIVRLNKSIKRQRVKTKVVAGIGLVGWILVAIR